LSHWLSRASQATAALALITRRAAPVVLVPIPETYDRIKKILPNQAYRCWLVEAVKTAYICILEITEKLVDGYVFSH
jgi:hypothetical protein